LTFHYLEIKEPGTGREREEREREVTVEIIALKRV
jgi:hypothetical protein